jgi:hypothetical protein
MSVSRALRASLTYAAVAVTAGLALVASAGLTAAQAAAGAARPAGLHVTGARIKLLGSSEFTDFSEAPNGSVYYANGSSVYVVSGSSAKLVLTVSGTVLAVAANSSGVFVEVGRTVTEYNSAHSAVAKWKLSSSHVPTAAGLYAVRGTLWAWTDYSVDGGSLQYANVYRFATSSATVHQVSTGQAYPGEMAADSTGAYYQADIRNVSYLVRVAPSGAAHKVRYSGIGLQLVLAGSRVDLLAYHVGRRTSTLYLDSYSQTTLAHEYSRRASASDRGIAATGAGLLLLSASCNSATCSSARVSQLSSRSGATESTLKLPDAEVLLSGPTAAAITYRRGAYYLVKLAS